MAIHKDGDFRLCTNEVYCYILILVLFTRKPKVSLKNSKWFLTPQQGDVKKISIYLFNDIFNKIPISIFVFPIYWTIDIKIVNIEWLYSTCQLVNRSARVTWHVMEFWKAGERLTGDIPDFVDNWPTNDSWQRQLIWSFGFVWFGYG